MSSLPATVKRALKKKKKILDADIKVSYLLESVLNCVHKYNSLANKYDIIDALFKGKS